MATVSETLITAVEFAQMEGPMDGSKQELVRGVIITMPPPGFRHGLRQCPDCRQARPPWNFDGARQGRR